MRKILIFLCSLYLIINSFFIFIQTIAEWQVKSHYLFRFSIYLLLGILLIATAVGISLLKKWAWYSFFGLSSLIILKGASMACILYYFITRPKPPGFVFPVNSFIAIVVLFIVIPIFYLVYFAQPKVKELFK